MGQNLTYTYTVVNNGPNDAPLAAITDPLPTGMNFVSGTVTIAGVVAAAPTLVGGSVVANLGTFTDLSTAIVTIVLSPTDAALPSAVNIATVSSSIVSPIPADGTVTVTTPVTALADVGVTITGPTGTVAVGQNVTYTINVINHGPNDASGVAISDLIPASLTNVSASSTTPGVTPTVNGSAVSATIGTLPVGSTATVTIVATATAAAAPSVSDTVTLMSTTLDPNPANNMMSVATSVTPISVVAVTSITATPDPVQVGQNLVYTINIMNFGPNDAAGVSFSDVLPANLKFISATSTLGATSPTYSANTERPSPSTLGALPAGSTAKLTITVQPTGGLIVGGASTQVTNTATIATQSIDNNSSNNSLSVTSTVTPSADLAVSLVPSPSTVVTGQSLTYTATVVNNGPSAAVSPSLSDMLPAGVTFVSALASTGQTGTVGSNGLVTVMLGTVASGSNLATLASGASATVTIVATPSVLVTTTIPDTVSVSSATPDPNATNNTTTQSVTANPSADVAVTITAPSSSVTAGQDVTYTINVTNNGPAAATNVMLTNTFPTNAAFTSSSTTATPGVAPTPGSPTISLGTLAPLATDVVTIVMTTNASSVSSILDSVSITSQPADLITSNNSASVQTAVSPTADVGVTISAPTSVTVGANLSYSINVTNNGPNTATGVVLTDTLPPLPADGTFVMASSTIGTQPVVTGSNVTANIGTLTAGSTATVTLVFTPNAGAVPTVTDTASVSNQVPDLNQTNNMAVATTTVTSIADVGVTVAAVGTVNAGGTLSYLISVINHGPDDASGVVLTDVLPANVAFSSGSATLGSAVTSSGGTVTSNIGSLHAGATDSLVIVVVPGAAAAGSVANTITITTASTDPSMGNNSATATTNVIPVSDVTVTLTSSATSVEVGQGLTYLATVTNNGPSAAPGVTLSDALPAGLSFLGATASNGTTPTNSGNNVTASLGTLAPSASVRVLIKVTPTQAAVPSVNNTVNVTANVTDTNTLNNSSSATTTITPIDVLSTGSPASIAATVAGQPLSGVVVASFSDANPSATAASFTASINWGDGTPATVGTVIANSGGGVNLLGSHTYTTAPNGGIGAFNVTTTLTAASGASLKATTQATVSVIPLTLTGQLNSASDSGASSHDGITNVATPNFNGTSEPGAVVTLVAQPLSGGSAFQIAQTTTNSSGFWNVNASHISDGSYAITAVASDSFGQTKSTTIMPASQPLVIDTTAPQIGTVVYNKAAGQITVVLQDSPAGFNLGSLVSGFSFTNAAAKRAPNLVASTAPQPLANGATTETELVTIKGGKKIKTGTYTLTVPAGIQDLAGNTFGHNLVYSVKPAKNKVAPTVAKAAAVKVHDAALHAVHASAVHHRRIK